MGNDQEADNFVFTNETILGQGCWKGRLGAIGGNVFGSVLLILPVLLGLLGPSRLPAEWLEMVAISLIFGSACLWGGIGLWRSAVVRTWTLTSEGIELHDALGQSRTLPWHHVERVRWGGNGVRFQDNRKQLFLPWGVIPIGRQGSVRRIITEHLTAFNLPAEGKRSVRSLVIALSLFLLLMFILLAEGLFVIMVLKPMAQRSRWSAMMANEKFYLFILLFLVLATLIPIRILREPVYWYDRQFSDFSRIGTPDP